MIHADFIDYIVHTLIMIGTSLFISQYSLLIKFITIDSIFSAYHFLKLFFSENISVSQIVQRSNLLYDSSHIDRYIFYTLEYIFYKIICGIFWVHDITVLYYIIFLTLIPSILNRLITFELFQAIIRKKEELIKIIIAKQSAFMIKLFAKMYLHKDVDIKYKELLPLLSNYDEATQYASELAKNLGMILLLVYIKNQSPNFYYRLTKYIYNYKTGDMLVSFNTDTAKITLSTIIDNKQWSDILKPNTCKAIFHLYQMNEDKTDIFKKLIIGINFKFIIVFTLWSLSSLFKNIYTAPIISLLLMLYKHKKPILHQQNLMQLGVLATVTILTPIINNNNYLITSFLCQFGPALIFNKLVYSIIEFLYKGAYKKISDIFLANMSYNVSLIFIFTNIVIFSFFPYTHILLILSVYTMFISVILNIKINLIFYLLMILNSLSNFNILHLCFLLIVLYIVLGSNTIHKINITDNFTTKIASKLHLAKYSLVNTFNKMYYGNKINSVVFEIMDIDKFPSISDIDRIKKVYSFKDLTKDLTNNKSINKQEVIKIIDKDETIDEDDIFDLPDSNFLDAISVGNNSEEDTKKSTRIEIKKKTDPIYIHEQFI